MALKPWELGQLTPNEYSLMVQGYNWREEQEAYKMRWLAWHAAMLPLFKQRPSYEEFVEQEAAQSVPAWEKSKMGMINMVVEHNKGVSK